VSYDKLAGMGLPDNVGSLLSLVQVEEPPDLGSSVHQSLLDNVYGEVYPQK
jgi:hypothetical protein